MKASEAFKSFEAGSQDEKPRLPERDGAEPEQAQPLPEDKPKPPQAQHPPPHPARPPVEPFRRCGINE
jgi:hypothetical protein